MGGTSNTTQQSSSSLAPYSPASGSINGILGSLGNLSGSAASLTPGQTGAISSIESNAAGTPNYSAPIASGTAGLLNGGGANNNNGAISSNLGLLNSNIGATASGANIGANSALQPQLDQIATDTANSVNSNWAAAGRDGSPGNSQALARGIAAGEAPVIAGQYNQDVANQQSAANSLYNAGNSTYGLLNQNQTQANQNFTNGVGTVSNGLSAENAAPNSVLSADSNIFGIPASQLQTLLGSISPVAAQFGTQNGTSSGTSTMSGIQQIAALLGPAVAGAKLAFG